MNTKIHLPEWDSISPLQWQALSQKKIFFAHMSVGGNILDGAQAVLQERPEVSLILVKTYNPAEMQLPALYHTELGYNTKPFLKIDSFCSMLNHTRPVGPDIAMIKLCYADIRSDTDTEALFKAYRTAISELKTQLPNTRVLHCTVPLESTPLSLKRKCKEIAQRLLARPTRTDHNYKRMRFNEMLRITWPVEQILDIAKIESTTPEGYLCCKIKRGQKIPFLCSRYTSDGGHLNDVGSRRVGQQFLIFLANAASQRK